MPYTLHFIWFSQHHKIAFIILIRIHEETESTKTEQMSLQIPGIFRSWPQGHLPAHCIVIHAVLVLSLPWQLPWKVYVFLSRHKIVSHSVLSTDTLSRGSEEVVRRVIVKSSVTDDSNSYSLVFDKNQLWAAALLSQTVPHT